MDQIGAHQWDGEEPSPGGLFAGPLAGRPVVLTQVQELVDGAREVAWAPLLALSTVEQGELLESLAVLERVTAAARLSVLRALCGADLTVLGATSLSGLVSARLRTPPGKARAEVAAARVCDPDGRELAGMGAALAAGTLSREHVDVAVAALEQVPTKVRREAAPVIDEFCVDTSVRYRPEQVRNLTRAILDRLDPDRGHDPEAFTRRSFTLTGDAYGMGLPSGQLDPATHAALKTALDHYAAPTPRQHDHDGLAVFTDTRTPGQRRCDALAEIARRALAAAGTGPESATRAGEPPRIVLHATPDQLTGTISARGEGRPGSLGGDAAAGEGSGSRVAVGGAECEATGPVPTAFLRGLLCDCVIERVLLAPNGAVLNLGRAVRTATAAQRRALHARDRGCVWPGCTIPARWADVHHAPPWIRGGTTDLDALALLCGGHHAQIEHGHYDLHLIDGHPPGSTPTAAPSATPTGSTPSTPGTPATSSPSRWTATGRSRQRQATHPDHHPTPTDLAAMYTPTRDHGRLSCRSCG